MASEHRVLNLQSFDRANVGEKHGGAEFYQIDSDSQDGKCQGETTLMAGIHLNRQEWMKNSY